MKRPLAISIALILVAATAYVVFDRLRERSFDPSFDVRVASPAFTGVSPRFVFDRAHANAHTADEALRPLAELVRHDGGRISELADPVDPERLRAIDVLVIAGARGANDAGDEPAFSPAELDAIDAWVRDGGALLVVTDHWPFGVAAAGLLERFGVGSCGGLVEDSKLGTSERGPSHVVYTRENGGIAGSSADHPILRGRAVTVPERTESIERVMTFSGQSLTPPPSGATVLLRLSDAAVSHTPGAAKVERSGGDVRVTMEYDGTKPVAAAAQAMALEHGLGRVVLLADAGMIRAHRDRNRQPVGMNLDGFDNRAFALNVMRWLGRAGEPPVLRRPERSTPAP